MLAAAIYLAISSNSSTAQTYSNLSEISMAVKLIEYKHPQNLPIDIEALREDPLLLQELEPVDELLTYRSIVDVRETYAATFSLIDSSAELECEIGRPGKNAIRMNMEMAVQKVTQIDGAPYPRVQKFKFDRSQLVYYGKDNIIHGNTIQEEGRPATMAIWTIRLDPLPPKTGPIEPDPNFLD